MPICAPILIKQVHSSHSYQRLIDQKENRRCINHPIRYEALLSYTSMLTLTLTVAMSADLTRSGESLIDGGDGGPVSAGDMTEPLTLPAVTHNPG